MKKFLILLLSLSLLLCSFFACSDTIDDSDEKNDTLRQLRQAMEKTEDYESGRVRETQLITCMIEGETYEMVMEMDGAFDFQDDLPVMRSDLTYEANGETILQGDVYLEGDWAFYDLQGERYKVNLADEEEEIVEGFEKLLLQKSYKDISATEQDGVTEFTLTVTSGVAKEAFAEQIEQAREMMLGTYGGDGEVERAVVTAKVEDGNMTSYRVEIDLSYDIQGTLVEISIVNTITFYDLGEIFNVEPIPGCYGFEEYEEDAGPSFGL